MAKSVPDPDFVLRDLTNSPITCVACVHQEIVCGTQDGHILVWHKKRRRVKHQIIAHAGHSVLWIGAVQSSNDLISQGRDGYMHLWKATEAGYTKQESIHGGNSGFCRALLYSESGRHLLAAPGEAGSTINIFCLSSKSVLFTLDTSSKEKKGMVMAITLETASTTLLVGYENGNIETWNLNLKTQLGILSAHSEPVMAMDYHEGIKKGISGSVDNVLSVWTIDPSGIIKSVTKMELTNPGVNCVSIRGDGRLLASGGWDKMVRLFTIKRLTPLAVLSCHTDSIQCVTFSEDNTLIVGSKDCAISVWSVYKDK